MAGHFGRKDDDARCDQAAEGVRVDRRWETAAKQDCDGSDRDI
jgi:hypothetical protein